jgi:TetR/AcrR family transcriptional repressor of mexJK operon
VPKPTTRRAPKSRAKTASTARRGRPKDPEKRAAILTAAKQLFAQAGFEGTSMDAIAQGAAVSKLTLYSHFADKDALFTEAVIQTCEEHAPPAFFDPESKLPLRERLHKIGNGFLDLVMDEEVIGVYRMMAAQARSSGKLGKLFFAAGPARTIEQFARLLAAATAAGDLEVPQPERAAGHFFCLLKGVCHLQVLMACRPIPGPEERRAQVEEAVGLFLRAYAPGAGRRPVARRGDS